MHSEDSRESMVTEDSSRQSVATTTISIGKRRITTFPLGELHAPHYIQRRLAFQPSEDSHSAYARQAALARHATPDFLLSSPCCELKPAFGLTGSNSTSSSSTPPLPELQPLTAVQPMDIHQWIRSESMDSDCSGVFALTQENRISHDEFDGVEIDSDDIANNQNIDPNLFPKPSPQVVLTRRGSQDSVTGSLRVAPYPTRLPPVTPRIGHQGLPIGYTPLPVGEAPSVKHGRPLETMCVDAAHRKKRRVGSMPDQSRFRSDFIDIELVGKGSFSDVFRVKHRSDGQLYAIKRLKKPCVGETDRLSAEREAVVLAKITNCAADDPTLSSHIIRYHSSWFEDGRVFIQTEYCASSLPSVVKDAGGRLTEQVAATLLRDVARGLKFLHSMDLVHLDIKPENILVSSAGTFKIADLGLVSVAGEPAEVTSGDARYLPREILLNNYRHLQKSDVFSLGATILECLIGRKLQAEGEQWHRLRDGHLPMESLRGVSNEFIQLIAKMLDSDPERRPNTDGILTSHVISIADPTKERKLPTISEASIGSSTSTGRSAKSPGLLDKLLGKSRLRRMFTVS